jgi:hypothetical protein
VINSRQHFEVNTEIHNINTGTKFDLHYPSAHLAVFQKGIYYAGIKVFNNLPIAIKGLSHNIKQFKLELESFLYSHLFYTLDECFKHKTNWTL